MSIFDKRINPEEIMSRIYKKRYISRVLMMLTGLTLIAIAFNLFLRPFFIVVGGVNGLSIVTSGIFDINPVTFIYLANAVMLYICLLILGPKPTLKALGVSLLGPFLIDITSGIHHIISLDNMQPLLACLYGGVITGFGIGLIYKAGYMLGGLDVIKNILLVKKKIPIGRSTIFIDGLVVLTGAFVFGWTGVMYSVITIYIIGVMIDRILLGISDSKAFYVISAQEQDIRKYAKETLDIEATVIKVKGSLRNSDHRMLMFIVPTKHYYLFKEGIKEIDERAFFYIVDVYQSYDGKTKKEKKKKLVNA